jgi:hypothetical protein
MPKTTAELIADITTTVESRPVQMPLWPPSERAMPNEFVAASVFSAMRTGDATFAKKLTLIGEWEGYRLHYKGRRLTQVHADVWMGVMEIAKWRPGAAKIVFSARQLLRIMGRDTGTAYREKIHEWITDMQTCLVQVTLPGGRKGYGAAVFPEAAWQKRPDGGLEYSLVVKRMLCEVFERGYSLVNHEQRKALGRNELALWLQQYITAFPMAVPLERLQALSGAPPSQRMPDFRRKLLVALRALQSVGGVSNWTIAPAAPSDRLIAELPRRLKAAP